MKKAFFIVSVSLAVVVVFSAFASAASVTITPGTYDVSVVNANGTSASQTFTVTEGGGGGGGGGGGTTMTVQGVKPGQTSVMVKDSSSPAKTVIIPINVIGALVADFANPASPPNISANAGSMITITLRGAPPYTIKTRPDSAVATAQISGNTLIITYKKQ